VAILAQLVDDVVVHKFDINAASTTLGRRPSNDIVIDDSAISSLHAYLIQQPNPDFPEYSEFFLEDNRSTNGSFINDLPVTGRKLLHHNDIIRLGWNKFKFINDSEADLEATVHMLNKTL